MKTLLLALILALIPVKALATPPLQGTAQDYYEADHFQWSNYDDDVHVLISYAGTMTIALVLEHDFGMKRWQAAFVSAFVVSTFGVAKEVLHDEYAMRKDIKGWYIGSYTAALTVTVFQF